MSKPIEQFKVSAASPSADLFAAFAPPAKGTIEGGATPPEPVAAPETVEYVPWPPPEIFEALSGKPKSMTWKIQSPNEIRPIVVGEEFRRPSGSIFLAATYSPKDQRIVVWFAVTESKEFDRYIVRSTQRAPIITAEETLVNVVDTSYNGAIGRAFIFKLLN
ncbi:hypothetical protein CCP2SC5_740011 [Azospirillaceae bacterium]